MCSSSSRTFPFSSAAGLGEESPALHKGSTCRMLPGKISRRSKHAPPEPACSCFLQPPVTDLGLMQGIGGIARTRIKTMVLCPSWMSLCRMHSC